MSEDQNTDVPPNHLSIDPRSAFYSEEVLRRDVGIRFNGVEKTNVHEYNVAEGWVRVEVPTAKDRRGNPMVVKLSGTVEPLFLWCRLSGRFHIPRPSATPACTTKQCTTT
ncbi:Protein of uncharacterised function (DUF3297) [Mycobacteroides abscessus subsp. massiliense]|nr:Protein of uncharacterised function (DUF3297) [Mycobacteroides abscessus subsp. massiliense]